ncbi:hypothetical protein [Undibacterium sp.]|jgi:hypothetical protein|uniref:hypothetical protein n=1 Tax=Undibacterium sp. TaxID=1914977 RepID=UPI002C0B072E|nr:hypothetical protein [Undibacterium sp.]HTD02449.1 hypothetical protein [Undibacterium sp.]
MNAQFDDNKDLPRANPPKKGELPNTAAEIRKMIHDDEHANAPGEPPFQLGEWIEGNVG